MKKPLRVLDIWALGVGVVITGEYFGWNFGLAGNGPVAVLVASLIVCLLYLTWVLALAELSVVGLQPPYALKGLGFAHKTEAGAVRLGLTSLVGQTEMVGAEGYLVEEMVTGAVGEVLLGLRRDPVYGVSLTLGMGGVTAEVLADTVTLILPVTEDEVLVALRRLRLWPLLDGYRGRPKADMAAVAAMAVRLGDLMMGDAALAEIEINPVLVKAQGAVAVDALIRRAE